MIISSGEFRRPGGRQLSAYPCVGCEKVNCPTGAREAGLGHDSARRFAGEQGSALRGGFLSARTERNQRAAREWAPRDRTGCAAPAQMTMAPSSAPFGGTFPLVGGRLGRAAQCAAPTGKRSGSVIGSVPLIRLASLGTFPQGKAWAGGASPSPTGFKEIFRNRVGEPLGAPARIRTGAVG